MGKKLLVVLAMVLIPIVILTACGGEETTTTSAPAATTPQTTAALTPSETETPTTTPATTPSETATEAPGPTPTETATEAPEPTPTETPEPTPTETTEPTPTETLEDTIPPEPEVFTLMSSAFENGEPMPGIYSYYGGNKSPPLSWSGAPEGTVSFALIMEDPDGGYWVHWIVFNIPSDVFELEEGLPIMLTLDNGAMQGSNSWGGMGYGGPAPPSGTHRYYFRLYALDTMLDLPTGALKYQLVNAMQDHILGEVELMGTFSA